jgi:hypothetical protein
VACQREQGGLDARDAEFAAVGPDDRPGVAQGGARHAQEQMVLDLVTKPTQQYVGERAAVDVARGQHLAAQEVGLVVRVEDRHALVVGRERRSQVEPEQCLLHQDEGQRPHRREHDEHNRQVGHGVDREQQRLAASVTVACAERNTARKLAT